MKHYLWLVFLYIFGAPFRVAGWLYWYAWANFQVGVSRAKARAQRGAK